MNYEKNKKTIMFSFRIDDDLYNKIEYLSKLANRSKSNFVITIITKAIEDIEKNNNIMNR